MTTRSTGQNWSLDIALAEGGFNALHPGLHRVLQRFDRSDSSMAPGLRILSRIKVALPITPERSP